MLFFLYLLTASKLESAALKDHVRVYANLLWNTTEKCKEEDVVRNIYIHELYETDDFLSKLAGCNDIKSLGGQYREECEKAEWIDTHPDYKADIIIAESTAFADGSISFLYKGGRGWKDFRTRLKNFSTWFDKDGVKNEYCESIVRAYIKLTPWAQDELYFDTSKENWRNRIFRGMLYDEVDEWRNGYEDITVGLLSNGFDSIKECAECNARIRSFKASLLSKENAWFIRWMMQNGCSNFYVNPKSNAYVFNRPWSVCVYWDTEWIDDEAGNSHKSLINKFFCSALDSGIRLSESYYRVVGDESGETLDQGTGNYYQPGKLGNNHLIAVAQSWTNDKLEFTYKNDVFVMDSYGTIFYARNEIIPNDDLPIRSIYDQDGELKDIGKVTQMLDALISSKSGINKEE